MTQKPIVLPQKRPETPTIPEETAIFAGTEEVVNKINGTNNNPTPMPCKKYGTIISDKATSGTNRNVNQK